MLTNQARRSRSLFYQRQWISPWKHRCLARRCLRQALQFPFHSSWSNARWIRLANRKLVCNNRYPPKAVSHRSWLHEDPFGMPIDKNLSYSCQWWAEQSSHFVLTESSRENSQVISHIGRLWMEFESSVYSSWTVRIISRTKLWFSYLCPVLVVCPASLSLLNRYILFFPFNHWFLFLFYLLSPNPVLLLMLFVCWCCCLIPLPLRLSVCVCVFWIFEIQMWMILDRV